MVYGVDFNIETAKMHFYIKGNTISPSESFQQATRTRNIKQLYFYGKDKNRRVQLEAWNAIEYFYKSNIDISERMCARLNNNDDEIFAESTFFFKKKILL